MFKIYVVALTRWGGRVFPPEAFEHFPRQGPWACLIESPDDEKTFAEFRPGYAWLIRSARQRGYSSSAA